MGYTAGDTQLSDGSGYRSRLWQRAVQEGLDITLVGSSNELHHRRGLNPDPAFPNLHEGHPGWWSWQLLAEIDMYLSLSQPDIILLMAGTNDIVRDATPQEAAVDLAALIDRILELDPFVDLIVSTVPYSTWVTLDKIDQFNSLIRSIVAERQLLHGTRIQLADLGPTMDLNLHLLDGVHPDEVGFGILANGWYEALEARVRAREALELGDEVVLSPIGGARASSQERSSLAAVHVTDGNRSTRWSSLFSDDEWLELDLGAVQTVTRVKIEWEAAFAREYALEVSEDRDRWTQVFVEAAGEGQLDEIVVDPVQARYVRLVGQQRATLWGYSVWEMEVYGFLNTEVAPPVVEDPVEGANLAAGRPVVSSSDEQSGTAASRAVDSAGETRWSSLFSDDEWIYVDLGTERTVSRVLLDWEGAYAAVYEIQVSNDAAVWSTVAREESGDGGVDEISFTAVNARYVRMLGVQRATSWGYSLWEFEVYADSQESSPPVEGTTANLAQGRQVVASSEESSATSPQRAIDAQHTTRWASAWSDEQWIYVDLGSEQQVSRVLLDWETAFASRYAIEVSTDAETWTTLFTEEAGDGGVDDIELVPVTTRYVRVHCLERATPWGYSLWELELY